ncbi:hypothetical protein HK098_000958 [Nowakowskiella sp. JEL0407]|nr:hypothetical protein HK098_000958 [Nowakowskiella sp. JEL0407]
MNNSNTSVEDSTPSTPKKSANELSSPWSVEEDRALKEGVDLYGEDCMSIKKHMARTKTVPDIRKRIQELSLTKSPVRKNVQPKTSGRRITVKKLPDDFLPDIPDSLLEDDTVNKPKVEDDGDEYIDKSSIKPSSRSVKETQKTAAKETQKTGTKTQVSSPPVASSLGVSTLVHKYETRARSSPQTQVVSAKASSVVRRTANKLTKNNQQKVDAPISSYSPSRRAAFKAKRVSGPKRLGPSKLSQIIASANEEAAAYAKATGAVADLGGLMKGRKAGSINNRIEKFEGESQSGSTAESFEEKLRKLSEERKVQSSVSVSDKVSQFEMPALQTSNISSSSNESSQSDTTSKFGTFPKLNTEKFLAPAIPKPNISSGSNESTQSDTASKFGTFPKLNTEKFLAPAVPEKKPPAKRVHIQDVPDVFNFPEVIGFKEPTTTIQTPQKSALRNSISSDSLHESAFPKSNEPPQNIEVPADPPQNTVIDSFRASDIESPNNLVTDSFETAIETSKNSVPETFEKPAMEPPKNPANASFKTSVMEPVKKSRLETASIAPVNIQSTSKSFYNNISTPTTNMQPEKLPTSKIETAAAHKVVAKAEERKIDVLKKTSLSDSLPNNVKTTQNTNISDVMMKTISIISDAKKNTVSDSSSRNSSAKQNTIAPADNSQKTNDVFVTSTVESESSAKKDSSVENSEVPELTENKEESPVKNRKRKYAEAEVSRVEKQEEQPTRQKRRRHTKEERFPNEWVEQNYEEVRVSHQDKATKTESKYIKNYVNARKESIEEDGIKVSDSKILASRKESKRVKVDSGINGDVVSVSRTVSQVVEQLSAEETVETWSDDEDEETDGNEEDNTVNGDEGPKNANCLIQ